METLGLTNTLRMEVIMKQITKKLLISSLSLGMIVLCCTGAFAREYIDEPCSETVSYVQSIEQQAWAISLMDGCNLNNTRATNRLDITIGAGKLLKADTMNPTIHLGRFIDLTDSINMFQTRLNP